MKTDAVRGIFVSVALLAAAVAVEFFATRVHAAEPEKPAPTLNLQDAKAEISGQAIKVLGVVIQGNAEAPVAYDVVIQLAVTPEGGVRVESTTASPAKANAQSAPAAQAVNFAAGTYTAGDATFVVEGPAEVEGGRKQWTFRRTDNKRYVFEGTWTTGPIDGHPNLATVGMADTLPKGLVYGLVTASSPGFLGLTRPISVVAVGESITITTYERVGREPFHIKDQVILAKRSTAPSK